MMAKLASTLSRLSSRERLLLILLGLVAVPVALVFAVALPLIEHRDRARAALTDSRALLTWVAARDSQWQAQTANRATSAAAPLAAASLADLEAALLEAGLSRSVDTLENGHGDAVSIVLGSAQFVAVGAFLEQTETALGYDIARLRITAADTPGQVDVVLDLEPVRGP
ncbi:MAG: type II secretion system protein GspM [Marinibacterium sp.]